MNSEPDAPLKHLILRELAREPGRFFDTSELSRRTHMPAPNLARTLPQLESAGLIVATRRKGVTMYCLLETGAPAGDTGDDRLWLT